MHTMQKSEIRKRQWEIAESLFSSLQHGKVLTGHVGDIIRICGIQEDGYTVGKFLQRAKSMPHMPFYIQRSFVPGSAGRRCVYQISLREEGRLWNSAPFN